MNLNTKDESWVFFDFPYFLFDSIFLPFFCMDQFLGVPILSVTTHLLQFFPLLGDQYLSDFSLYCIFTLCSRYHHSYKCKSNLLVQKTPPTLN